MHILNVNLIGVFFIPKILNSGIWILRHIFAVKYKILSERSFLNDLAQSTIWAKFGSMQISTEPQWLKNGATFGITLTNGTTYGATKSTWLRAPLSAVKEDRRSTCLSCRCLSYTVASRAFVCQMPPVKGAPLISPEKNRGENLSKTSEL